MWHNDDVDRLHVKRNRLVGMNYLGIIDTRMMVEVGNNHDYRFLLK